MAYQGQTFARNIAPYGETPYTQEDLDAAEEKKRKQEAVVDTSNPYAQTYKELSGEEKPKVEEAAAGKNISGRYFPQNVLDQEVLNKQNAAKKQAMIMQFRQIGISAPAAEQMANKHIKVENKAKQLEIEGTMLKADEAENALNRKYAALNERSDLNQMMNELDSLDHENIRDTSKKIDLISRKYRPLTSSPDPQIAKQAQGVLDRSYAVATDYRNAAEKDKVKLGSSKLYFNPDGTVDFEKTEREGAYEREQAVKQAQTAAESAAGGIRAAQSAVDIEKFKEEAAIKEEVATRAEERKMAAKASLKNSIEGQYGKPAATLFTGVWGKEPGAYGSVKIKDDPKNPDIVLVSHPSISKGKPLPIKRSDWEAQQSSGAGTAPTGSQQETTGGKELNQDMARKFLNQAGGDAEKARAMARDAGYSF
jgi:hypothetical protein